VLDKHLERYRRFREDAAREELNPETRVEAYFLAAHQLIEACAAKNDVHIGKHQNVRTELMANGFVFGDRTESVWRSFQSLENRLRPKFVYGFNWTQQDFEQVLAVFGELERWCQEVLR